jgi:hypothetical protein
MAWKEYRLLLSIFNILLGCLEHKEKVRVYNIWSQGFLAPRKWKSNYPYIDFRVTESLSIWQIVSPEAYNFPFNSFILFSSSHLKIWSWKLCYQYLKPTCGILIHLIRWKLILLGSSCGRVAYVDNHICVGYRKALFSSLPGSGTIFSWREVGVHRPQLSYFSNLLHSKKQDTCTMVFHCTQTSQKIKCAINWSDLLTHGGNVIAMIIYT